MVGCDAGSHESVVDAAGQNGREKSTPDDEPPKRGRLERRVGSQLFKLKRAQAWPDEKIGERGDSHGLIRVKNREFNVLLGLNVG